MVIYEIFLFGNFGLASPPLATPPTHRKALTAAVGMKGIKRSKPGEADNSKKRLPRREEEDESSLPEEEGDSDGSNAQSGEEQSQSQSQSQTQSARRKGEDGGDSDAGKEGTFGVQDDDGKGDVAAAGGGEGGGGGGLQPKRQKVEVRSRYSSLRFAPPFFQISNGHSTAAPAVHGARTTGCLLALDGRATACRYTRLFIEGRCWTITSGTLTPCESATYAERSCICEVYGTSKYIRVLALDAL